MYLLIVSILFTIFLWKYLKWKSRVFDKIEKIRGPKTYPIVGTLYMFRGASRADIMKIMLDTSTKYGPFFRTWKMYTPEIHIMKPEHMELILSSSVHLKKATGYKYMSSWLGEGLLLSDGAKWHRRRKMITPTFHFKILDSFMNVFREKCEFLTQQLMERCDGKPFDIYPYINLCTLDIICAVCYIKTLRPSVSSSSSMLIIKKIATPLHQTRLYPFLREGKLYERHLKVMHDFTDKVIAERRAWLKRNPRRKASLNDVQMTQKKRSSFLDLLLDNSEELSDTDVREEVDTFMFEGHDTTTAAVVWTLLLLANHQDVQEKVYQEIKTVLNGKSTPESISELNDLKYLDCCVKESLRLYPSVPMIGRTLVQDITIDGYEIPKDTDCNLRIYELHRNPDAFPDPERFDPDRFLPENSSKRHPYAYIPFSAGPRNCIGQKFAIYEEKTMLASIISNFKILPVDDIKSLSLVFELILKPIDGINVVLEKRNVEK